MWLGPGPTLALLGGLLLVVGACGDDSTPPRPPIVWTGAHVQVGTDLDLGEWCPGTLSRLDAYAGALKELFVAPRDHVITYYLYPPPLTEHDLCEGNRACHVKGAIFTTELFDAHELVHGVSSAHGSMPHFFEEGAAAYWGQTDDVKFADLDLREALDEHWSGGADPFVYALAVHFTSYLVHTYGREPYAALLQRASREQSRAEFARTFERVLGVTLDEAIDDYEARWPSCGTWATHSSFYECARPATRLAPDDWTEFDLDLSCADPEVVGPSALGFADGVARIWRDLTIEVETAEQTILFDIPAPGEPNTVLLEIKRCDTFCGDASTWRAAPNNADDPNLYVLGGAPGRYILRVSRAAEDPGPVRFRWR